MRRGSLEDVLDLLSRGGSVFVQGVAGEVPDLTRALEQDPARAAGVEFTSCLVPGVNAFDYAAAPGGPSLATFMASPALEAGLASGRTTLIPASYSQIPAALLSRRIDLAILHTAPPDASGVCSFGMACDTAPIVWPRSGTRVAFINSRMPAPPRSPGVPLEALDLIVEIDTPLLSPAPARQVAPSAGLAAIARQAAALVPEGAVIETGIGEAPGATVAELAGHRGLRVWTGIATPGYRRLAEAGALEGGRNLTGFAWGPPDFYDWLAASDRFEFADITRTHDIDAMSRTERFTAINSAIEIDLAGNLNVEWLNGRRISSIGGALDFAIAAQRSAGGRAIVVMPAAARNGASRIVPHLGAGRISVPAELADTVVTEHGVAELAGKTAEARARALIAIADPRHREALEAAMS